jgi:hypothetical protein
MVSPNDRLRLPPPWISQGAGKSNREQRSVITVERRRPSSTLWTLANTATELLLLPNEAGTVTTTSGAVSQIRDFKDNGRVFGGAAGSRPTITPNALNGKASLTFSGSQWLTFAGLASVFNMLHTAAGAGSTVVAVWKAGTNSNPNTFYGLLGNSAFGTLNHGFAMGFDDRLSATKNDSALAQIVRGVSNQPTAQNASANNTHPANTPAIIVHTSNPAASLPADRSILRINGTEFKNNIATSAASTANATHPLQVGAAGNNLFPLVGDIYIISILPPGTTQDTTLRAEGYVAGPVAGWNLQGNLPAGHPYKVNAPTV